MSSKNTSPFLSVRPRSVLASRPFSRGLPDRPGGNSKSRSPLAHTEGSLHLFFLSYVPNFRLTSSRAEFDHSAAPGICRAEVHVATLGCSEVKVAIGVDQNPIRRTSPRVNSADGKVIKHLFRPPSIRRDQLEYGTPIVCATLGCRSEEIACFVES